MQQSSRFSAVGQSPSQGAVTFVCVHRFEAQKFRHNVRGNHLSLFGLPSRPQMGIDSKHSDKLSPPPLLSSPVSRVDRSFHSDIPQPHRRRSADVEKLCNALRFSHRLSRDFSRVTSKCLVFNSCCAKPGLRFVPQLSHQVLISPIRIP